MPKKATRQIAQKLESKLDVKSRVECIRVSKAGVIGSFWDGGVPATLLMPVSRDLSAQLLSRGLGKPNSLCNTPMMLR